MLSRTTALAALALVALLAICAEVPAAEDEEHSPCTEDAMLSSSELAVPWQT